MQNLNTHISKTMNEEDIINFNTAINLYKKNLTQQELINLIAKGTITEKQVSVLKLEKLTSEEDAKILLSNLTGQDGKVREAISFKLKEFMNDPQYINYFYSLDDYSVFLDAIVDINGNICRNIISAIQNLKDYEKFYEYFCPQIAKKTLDLIEKIKKFDLQDGKYKVNKEVFKLYWCLETIYNFYDKFDIPTLKVILSNTKEVQDYTIREKTAKILSKELQNPELLKIKQELKEDKNYYVRRF